MNKLIQAIGEAIQSGAIVAYTRYDTKIELVLAKDLAVDEPEPVRLQRKPRTPKAETADDTPQRATDTRVNGTADDDLTIPVELRRT